MKTGLVKSFVFVFAVSALGLMSLSPRQAQGVTSEDADALWNNTEQNSKTYQEGYDAGQKSVTDARSKTEEEGGCCGGMGI